MKQYSKLIFDFANTNKVEWDNGKITATVTSSEDIIEFVKRLESSSVSNYQVTKDSLSVNSGRISIGDTLEIILRPPRGPEVFFAWNFDDLLQKSSLIYKPNEIIIFKEDYISWETSSQSKKLRAYEVLSKFLNRLIDLGVLKKVDDELWLLSSDRFLPFTSKINTGVLEENADGILKGIWAILEVADAPLHTEDKKRILRSVLLNNLKNAKKDERLNHFLKHFDEISKNYSNNYELFISDFSFEDDMGKLLKQQEDFSNRLSAIFTSIQTKILAIPVTLILAFGEMKIKSEDFPIFVNSAILVAALIFSILLWVLLSSQTEVLLLLKNEMDAKKELFSRYSPNLQKGINSAFDSLNNQYTFTNTMIKVLKSLIVVGFLATLLTYVYMTPQVNEAFGNFLTTVVGSNVEIPDPTIFTATPNASSTVTPTAIPSPYPAGSP